MTGSQRPCDSPLPVGAERMVYGRKRLYLVAVLSGENTAFEKKEADDALP
jgi:hypothetical protein